MREILHFLLNKISFGARKQKFSSYKLSDKTLGTGKLNWIAEKWRDNASFCCIMKGEDSVIPEFQQTGKCGTCWFLVFRCFHKCFLHLIIVVFLNSDTMAVLLFKYKKEVGIDFKKLVQSLSCFKISLLLNLPVVQWCSSQQWSQKWWETSYLAEVMLLLSSTALLSRDDNKAIIFKQYCKSEEEMAVFSINILLFSLCPTYLYSGAPFEALCKCLVRLFLGSALTNVECVQNSLQNLNLGFWQSAFPFYYTGRGGKAKCQGKVANWQQRAAAYNGCKSIPNHI